MGILYFSKDFMNYKTHWYDNTHTYTEDIIYYNKISHTCSIVLGLPSLVFDALCL